MQVYRLFADADAASLYARLFSTVLSLENVNELSKANSFVWLALLERC
jgi:hypothetical protein